MLWSESSNTKYDDDVSEAFLGCAVMRVTHDGGGDWSPPLPSSNQIIIISHPTLKLMMALIGFPHLAPPTYRYGPKVCISVKAMISDDYIAQENELIHLEWHPSKRSERAFNYRLPIQWATVTNPCNYFIFLSWRTIIAQAMYDQVCRLSYDSDCFSLENVGKIHCQPSYPNVSFEFCDLKNKNTEWRRHLYLRANARK